MVYPLQAFHGETGQDEYKRMMERARYQVTSPGIPAEVMDRIIRENKHQKQGCQGIGCYQPYSFLISCSA
jgi:hypothetical protein